MARTRTTVDGQERRGTAGRAWVSGALLGPLLLVAISCGGGGEPAVVAPVRVAVPRAWPADPWLPEFAEPFGDALGAFTARTGIGAIATPWMGPDAAVGAYEALTRESPPDLVVVPAPILPELVDEGRLLPLDEWVSTHAAILTDLPPEVFDTFRVDGPLYAVPLGAGRGHAELGFAVPTAAQAAGRAALALALLADVRERAPLRDGPDPAVSDARVLPPNPDLQGEENGVFEVHVANFGDMEAPATRLDIRLDEQPPFSSVDVPALPPLEEVTFWVGLPVPTLDQYVVHARLDADSAIAELQEGNNEAASQWTVVPFAGGMTPPAIMLTGGPYSIDANAYRADTVGGGPKVAFDGTNYLVVWTKQKQLTDQRYQHELRARRVSPSGTVLDALPGIAVTSGPGYYPWFDVAYGAGTFLVVWENGADFEPGGNPNPGSFVEGRRISPSGQVLDANPISIEATPSPNFVSAHHRSVALCFDGQDFLVFERTTGISGGEGVWTRKVQPTGSVGTTRSLVFSTSPLFGAYGKLAASYSGTRGFLAYSGYTATAAPMGGTTVTSRFSYATELPPPPQGAVGIAVPLVSHSAGNAWSDNTATAAARQDNFAFAWDERVAPAAVVLPRVHAAILATPLDTLSQSITIPTLRCDEKPAIDYDGAYYLLAWVRVVGCHSYPGLCSLSPLGARGPIFRLDTPLSDLVSAVDVACGTTNACVAYATWLPASALGAPQGHSAVGFFFVNLP